METIVKTNIAKMKVDIKKMVELQKFYKNQRKTKNLVGERKIPTDEATWKHITNREDLRIMYGAYGLARGKSFSQIENNYPEDNHPLKYYEYTFRRILKGYEIKVKIETEVES
jgi:hypothetical protein